MTEVQRREVENKALLRLFAVVALDEAKDQSDAPKSDSGRIHIGTLAEIFRKIMDEL